MYRHGPDGDGVALQGVPEVGHHVRADEPVERLDEVEPHVDGDEKGQHDPVVQVQPRDLASVGRQVRVRGPRRMLGGGGGGIFSSPCSPDRTGQRQESRRALVAASAWQLQRPARKGSNSSSARPAAGCCNRRDPDIPSYGEGDDAHGMRREYSQRTGVVEVNGLGHEPTSSLLFDPPSPHDSSER